MVQYDFGDDGPNSPSPLVKLTVIHPNHPPPHPQVPANDLLYCFEGGTGAVYGDKTPKKYHSWSMMGFVLASVSEKSASDYDLYIVFRGSRSGKLRHHQAGWTQVGNPDWVTDWQVLYLEGDPEISQYGQCSKGFAASIKSMFPTIIRCLEEVARQKQTRPSAIYVTGHSLGAALACQFASAVLWGTRYGLWGNNMPPALRTWPWDALRLVTYAAPAVGDWQFCRSFAMVSPSSKRVWVEGDTVALSDIRGWPMGSDLAKAGKTVLTAVGEAFRLSPPKDVIKGLDPHDPLAIRKSLLWWLGSFFPQILQGIPMTKDDQPWKLFTLTKTFLSHLADKKTSAEFSTLIPEGEAFLLKIVEALCTAHKTEPELVKKLGSLSDKIKECNTKQYNAYVKLGELRSAWEGFSLLKSKYNALWRLLGLSLLFNALSKDGSLMQSTDVAAMIEKL
jgi:hypothetical protein